jgi:hypothetical protein
MLFGDTGSETMARLRKTLVAAWRRGGRGAIASSVSSRSRSRCRWCRWAHFLFGPKLDDPNVFFSVVTDPKLLSIKLTDINLYTSKGNVQLQV